MRGTTAGRLVSKGRRYMGLYIFLSELNDS